MRSGVFNVSQDSSSSGIKINGSLHLDNASLLALSLSANTTREIISVSGSVSLGLLFFSCILTDIIRLITLC